MQPVQLVAGAPEEIRTPDPQIRSLMLFRRGSPGLEIRCHRTPTRPIGYSSQRPRRKSLLREQTTQSTRGFCTEDFFPYFFSKSLKASMARALRVVSCSAASIRRALHPSAFILVMIPLNASGSRALFLVFACAKMPPTSLQWCIEALSCHCETVKLSICACVLARNMITSDNRSSRK